MPSDRHKEIPADSLLQLRQRLDRLPRKSPERTKQVAAIAELYGVSPTTVYRALEHSCSSHAPSIAPTTANRAYCRSLSWNVTAS